MAGHVTIRTARVADATDIGRIHVRAWQVGYRDIMPAVYLDGLDANARGRQWEVGLAQREVEPDGTSTMLAELDRQLVGICVYGSYRLDDSEEAADSPLAELLMLNVDPEFWGTGVAQALDAHALGGLCVRWPRETAALWVLDDNARGRRFYEKEGWEADGVSKDEDVGGTSLTELRYTIGLA